LKQTICARAGNKTVVESVTPHDEATRTRPKNLSRAFRDVHGAHHTDGDMSAPIHPTLPAIERAKQKKPLRSPDAIATPIARALDVSRTALTSEPTDQSARTVTSRFATYRETIETLVSRARSRIDRMNQIVSRISRAGRDRSNRGRVVPLRRESRASGRILGRWTPWR